MLDLPVAEARDPVLLLAPYREMLAEPVRAVFSVPDSGSGPVPAPASAFRACVRAVRAVRESGATELILPIGAPTPLLPDVVRLLGAEVLPYVRSDPPCSAHRVPGAPRCGSRANPGSTASEGNERPGTGRQFRFRMSS